eukprot:7802736-Pyramimonas_sp.AAC.1
MCPWCNCSSRNAHNHYDGFTLNDLPWGTKAPDTYFEARSRCSKILRVDTPEKHKAILDKG